jgi:hypothetical protein
VARVPTLAPRFFARRRLSVAENCLAIGYFALVTLVVLWLVAEWAAASDQASFAGIWLFVFAPFASLPLLFTSLYGEAFLVGVYVLFLVEFALAWLAWTSLRARAAR